MKKRRRFQAVVLIVLMGTAVYVNSLTNEFVYDDEPVVKDCRFIRSWSNLPSLFTPAYFRLSGEMTYRPVVTFSYLLDYTLWKLKPFGYRLTNIVLHVLNGVLVYVFIRLLLRRPAVALVTALLFCVHPVTAEAVNAVSFREDLFALTFSLLAFIAYLKVEPRHRLHFILCPIFFALALFSKEMAVVLPLLFLLSEICFHRDLPAALKKRISLYATLAAALGFYLLVRFVLLRNLQEPTFDSPPLWQRILFMTTRVFFYLKLLIFPAKLSLEYSTTLSSAFPEPGVILSATALIAISGFSTFFLRRFPEPVFGLWWFLLALVPVANIVPLYNPVAERYLYLPMMGFCLLLALAGEAVFLRLRPPAKYLPLAVLTIVLCLYSIRTVLRNCDWKDRFTLYRKTVESCPGSSRFHYNLGLVYSEKKMYPEAIHEYQSAIRLNPSDAKPYFNLGNVYFRQGLYDQALRLYETVRKLDPEYIASVHGALANVYFKQERYQEAETNWKKALESEPENAVVLNNLAFFYADTGNNLEEALELAKKALSLEAGAPEVLDTLGWVYYKQGRLEQAREALTQACSLDPENAAFREHLDRVQEALEKGR